MARRGSFGRSGTSQNLTMLVYQLLKQKMTDEIDSILQSYRTNMKEGTYTSQFNGQNVDGEYVMDYYRQMLSGFPPGSTEYETINSKLKAFEAENRSDVQNLIINAMNNGTQIDFGLLGSKFENKGISEVELTDLSGWASQEIADLRANGEIEQADKLSGAVFVAKFNVVNDEKTAAYYKGDITAGQLAQWLGGQLKSALESGLTESSDAYREILKQQASALKTARTEGQAESANNYRNEINGLMGRLSNLSEKLFDKYRELGGVFSSEIDRLVAENGGDSYKALIALADGRGNSESTYGAAYGSIFQELGTDPEELGLADAVGEVMNKLNKMEDDGFKGVSDEERIKLGAEIDGVIALNKSFVATSGISFNSTAGQALISGLYKGLKGSGVFSVATGIQENVYGGHPDLVQQAFAEFGKGLGNIDLTGYEYLSGFAEGKFSTTLLPSEARGAFTSAEMSDSFITKDEWYSMMDRNPMPQADMIKWIDNVVVTATRGLPFPGATGSADVTANSAIKAMADSFAAGYILDRKGGTMVVQPSGVVSVTENPRDVDGTDTARTVMMPPGPDGKVRFAKSIPLKITQDVAQENRNPYNFPVVIEIYSTGGNAGADNTFMVIQGSNGQSHQIPYYKGKKWLEATGFTLDDSNFITAGDKGTFINVTSEPTDRSQPTFTERFKNFDNPASEFFWGTTTTGKGMGIIDVNENTVSSTYYYGIVGKSDLLGSVINGIIGNGRDAILSAATEMAKKEGREVDRDYINRAAFSMIPNLVESNNTLGLELPLLMKNPKITNMFNTWFSNIKAGTGSMTPGATPNPSLFPNYNPSSTYNGPGGTPFPQRPTTNDKFQPTTVPGSGSIPQLNSGYVANNSFVGEAFRNRPALVQAPPKVGSSGIAPSSTPKVSTPSYVTSYSTPPPSKTTPNKANASTTNNAGAGTGNTGGTVSGYVSSYNKV